ncbi:LPS export ABC transporter periplasmic protein LptC [Mitsuaria sp. WAJ17]|uniref:LPS export ABC transporter periplasmic protein LptC n=1 Tax=Mitsuaria sp. WAJ17 TaxID=2761452 RepID=UPI0016033470|nr:LPS export ABC transporter periplasmic protein LptC [Mitsuaria sp. WAJ17]MBB2487706.1 LPS export ABC transporter periplasmic protein LptC [Mitsuaria sp. WAJ17]
MNATSSTPLAPPPAPARRREAPPLLWRLQNLVGTYLPLLILALLAAFTWWLVKSTPLPDDGNAQRVLRHEPDYQMQGFELQRFTPDGALTLQVRGREMRHYPDTDTLEIDGIELRALGKDGTLTIAEARQALSNADASEIRLQGDVLVRRYAQAQPDTQPAQLEISGEFLQLNPPREQMSSHLPVTLRTGQGSFSMQSFEYDNLSGQLKFHGRSTASYLPRRKRP